LVIGYRSLLVEQPKADGSARGMTK
jgi:hypothetical protein